MGNLVPKGGKHPPALSAPAQGGQKGVCYVACQTVPNRGFELLVKYEGRKAVIGAKRIAKPRTVQGSSAATAPQAVLSGEMVTANGVDYSCPHCTNSGMFLCGCGIWYCSNAGTTSRCPVCHKVTEGHTKQGTTTMKTVKAARSRAALPHRDNTRLAKPLLALPKGKL